MKTVTSCFSHLKSILLFMGATFFAYLFSLTLHEIGHYLAGPLLGVPQKEIVLNPFGANYNIYLGELSVAVGTPWRRVFKGLSGPLFDLLLTVVISLLLWRKRSPRLLPILMLGGIALVHESVNTIMSSIDGYGDWAYVREINVPFVIVSLLAVVLLVAGCIWMLQLLPLVGITPRDPFWPKLIVFLTGMPFLFLCSVIYQTLFGMAAMEEIRTEKLIFMAASTALTVIITALHRPLFPWLDRLSHTPAAQVRWLDALIASGLGATMVIIQLAFFNDPTVIVVMK